MKKRFTEEQIIKVLDEVQAGLKVAEVCRKYGVSEPTYYNWKSEDVPFLVETHAAPHFAQTAMVCCL